MAVRPRCGDLEKASHGTQRLTPQHRADGGNLLVIQRGKVGQRALPYPTAVTVGLAQEIRWAGVAIGYDIDVHGHMLPAQAAHRKRLHGYIMQHAKPAKVLNPFRKMPISRPSAKGTSG